MARTMMIHAKLHWPSAITHNLWPYAIRYANQILNETPMKNKDQRLPISIISDTNVNPNQSSFRFSYFCLHRKGSTRQEMGTTIFVGNLFGSFSQSFTTSSTHPQLHNRQSISQISLHHRFLFLLFQTSFGSILMPMANSNRI